MTSNTWRFVTSEADLKAWEENPLNLSCAVELILPDAAPVRLAVVTQSWLRQQLDRNDRWSTYGPMLVLGDGERGPRAAAERALEGGHVHAFHRPPSA